MKIEEISTKLRKKLPGFWVADDCLAISYPEEGNSWCFRVEESSFWFCHRNSCILEVVKGFPPAGLILDIGGGNGFVSQAIERSGYEVALLEPGWEGVRNSRSRGLANVIHSTFEGAGLKNGCLPAAGLFDVLEHIENDFDFLKMVKDSLIPGGLLYLTVPANRFLWSVDDEFAGHHRRYSSATLKRTLRRAGFDVDFFSHIFSILPIPLFLLRVLPQKIGLRRSVDLEIEKKRHDPSLNTFRSLLDGMLAIELACLRRGWTIPFGGSLLLVARAQGPIGQRRSAESETRLDLH